METETFIRTIEWDMMDKTKFFPLSVTSSFTIRAFLYPFTLIKTRLQIQRGNEIYRGTFDAYRKILKYEGFSGLYRGFWVNAFSVVSGAFYIATYENVRHFLHKYDVTDSRVKALVAGGAASLVGQTIIVPFDVLSQHLMMMGKVNSPRGTRELFSSVAYFNVPTENRSKSQIAIDLTREIYKCDGFRGFYRGYLASLCTYVPNSALWWSFYHFYQDQFLRFSPPWVSHLALQCCAAVTGGVTTTIIINPLDIIRARLQVQRLDSFAQTFRILWAEERLGIFTKGLSARIVQSVMFSFAIVLGYESVKRMSVREQYREQVKW